MERRSATLYFDEDFELGLLEPLRERGFTVFCSRDEDMNGKSDEEQLAFAAEKGWAIVTHDIGHFQDLAVKYAERGLEHGGIIVSKRMAIGRVLRCLLNLLNRVSADEMHNLLLYLQNFES